MDPDRPGDTAQQQQTDEAPPAAEPERSRLIDAVILYLELQASGGLSEDKMRAELDHIKRRFDQHSTCPAGEKATVYRKDATFYTMRKNLVETQQRSRSRQGPRPA